MFFLTAEDGLDWLEFLIVRAFGGDTMDKWLMS
jgi:hypothetical protein